MEQSLLIEVGLPIALFIIMTGIGLTLTVADFQREGRAPRGLIVGSIGQLLVMPLLGFAVAALMGLPPAIAVGIVIVAACPGGTTSNLVAYLARANVALSIALTVIASIATILTLPLAANLAIRWQPAAADAAVRVPVGRTIALLIGIVLVPVTIGMVVRRRSAAYAAKVERSVAIFGGLVLLALVVGIAYSVRDEIWTLLAQAGPASGLLAVAGLVVGAGSAWLARLPLIDGLTIAVELGVKNSTLGILIAITVVGSETMAVPPAVYGLLMYVPAAAVVAYGRRVLDASNPEAPSVT